MGQEHNAIVQYPGLLRGYVQAVGLDETADGVTRLGETLTPVIDLFNGRREWALQRGEQWYSKREFQAAGGAGTFTSMGIGNPTGSGIVVVVEKFHCQPAAATQVLLAACAYADFAASLALAGRGYPMDRRRIGNNAASVAELREGTPAGFVAGSTEVDVASDAVIRTMPFPNMPWILYAGDAIYAANQDDAAGMGITVQWYERKCVTNEARG